MTALRIAWLQIRRHLASTIVLALLLGLALGVVLTAVTGARRNQTAYRRLLEWGHASDVLVNPNYGVDSKLEPAKVAKLPQVETMGQIHGMFAAPDDHGKASLDDASNIMSAVADHGYLHRIDRPRPKAGRVPEEGNVHEVALTPGLAKAKHLQVGDTWVSHWFSPRQVGQIEGNVLPPGKVVHSRIVGILQDNWSVVSDDANVSEAVIYGGGAGIDSEAYYGLMIRLRAGYSLASLEHAVEHLVPAKARAKGDTMVFQTRADVIQRVERITGPQTIALEAFGAVAGIALLFVAGQAILRHVESARRDVPILAAMGATQRTIVSVLVIRALAITLVAGAVGIVTAIALSPLTPIGLARVVEPHPGVAVDVALLLAGSASFVAILVAATSVPLWRLARRTGREAAPAVRPLAPRVTGWIQNRPAAALGTRHALASGRTGTGRSAVLGATLAVLWLVAATVFAASLSGFVARPADWGWHWDDMIILSSDDTGNAVVDRRADIAAVLDRAPEVIESSIGTTTEVTLGGHRVTAIAMTPHHGRMPATVVVGRTPRIGGEVALGRRTLRMLDAKVGDTVPGVDKEGRPIRLTIVGQAVFPGLASYPGEDPTSLGSGALITMSGYQRYGAELSGPMFFVDSDGPISPATKAALRRVKLPSGEDAVEQMFDDPRRPSDVKGLTEVRRTPYLLAGVLAVFALLTVGHTLITDVRRRRRELAVCKAVGFTGRQVGAVVAWQATTVIAVGLLIGVPLGIAAGRFAWTLTAHQLGVPAHPDVPLLLTIAIVATAVVAANLLAAIPGLTAARIPSAEALRDE